MLIDMWWREAENEGVLPLDDRGVELFGVRHADRTPHPSSKRYVYTPPMSPLPSQASATIGGRSWDLDADIESAGDSGVIYATGTENSGITLFVDSGHLVFDYNIFGEHHIVRSEAEVPTGRSRIGVRFRRLGRHGRAEIHINGTASGAVEVPFVMRVISSVGSSIGYDHGSPVGLDYSHRRDGFPFSGSLERVIIQLVAREEADVAAAEQRAAMGRQ